MGTKRIQLSGIIETTTGNQCWPADPAPGFQGGPFIGENGGDPSWDLEARNLTNPDLAAAGWIVQLQNAPYTKLTRNGDVQADTVGAPVGTYNSTLKGGVLVMQGPVSPSNPIQIYRQSDGLPHTYEFHVWCENWQSGNSDYCFFSNTPNYGEDPAMVWFYTGLENAAPRHCLVAKLVGSPPVFTKFYEAVFENWQQDLVRYIRIHADGLQTQFKFGLTNGQLVEANPPTADGAPPANYVGVWMNAVLNHCFYIDFIRRKPENQYP